MTRKTFTFYVIDLDQQKLALFRTICEQLSQFVYCCNDLNTIDSIMEGVAPDFVICNHQIQDIDVTSFLNQIKIKFPNSIRIVYGDDDHRQTLMKMVASGRAHRFFTHPCNEESVLSILKRDLLTRSRLRRNKSWKFLEAGDCMPALPAILLEIEEVINDENFSIDALVKVIAKDPVISSKLLQVVNSAAFSLNSTIGDLHHAVTYLGINQIREIVLFISALTSFSMSDHCRSNIESVGEHSFHCSRLATEIARHISPDLARETAMAALLHDIGKLLFLSTSCGMYKDYLDNRELLEIHSTDFETDMFGVSHTELGSSLLLWWNLPMTIIETAANHNLPLTELSGVPLIVSIADRCLLEAELNGNIKSDLDDLADEYPIDEWRQKAWDLVKG